MDCVAAFQADATLSKKYENHNTAFMEYSDVPDHPQAFPFHPRAPLGSYMLNAAVKGVRNAYEPHADPVILSSWGCLIFSVSTVQASIVLQRCPPLARAAERGELVEALCAAPSVGAKEYIMEVMGAEVIGELHTPWTEAVTKWR